MFASGALQDRLPVHRARAAEMKVPGCEESMISSLFVEIDDIAQLRALLLNSILNIFADFLVQSNRTIALSKMVRLMESELEIHIFRF